MEVLNPIYMAPNMTVLTKTFILHCVMKRDGVNRMFPFAKWGIIGVQDMGQKIINRGWS